MNNSFPHVLVLPTSYPSFHSPVNGSFVRDQVCALRGIGVHVGVVYPDLRGWRTLAAGNVSRSRFQTVVRCGENGDSVTVQGWYIPQLNFSRRLWKFVTFRGLDSYIKLFGQPDLCHAHEFLWAGMAANEIQKRYGIPYVVTEHSSAYARKIVSGEDQELTRKILAEASAVVCVSRALRTELEPYAKGKQICVVPNLVDADFFTLPDVARPRGRFRFLSMALLTAIKRIDLLIKAFEKAFRDHTQVELEIAGDGPERQRLEELASMSSTSGRIYFSGMRTRAQVRESMWRSNAVVTSSRVETFGIVLAEALATGLPVLSTRCGGPEDIVTRDVGILVARESVDALAQGLTQLWREYDRYDPKYSRETVLRTYAAPVVANQLLAVYAGKGCAE